MTETTIKEDIALLSEYIEQTKQFNIFKILKLENYEIRHSNFLAWLLNPQETHGLGGYFLCQFIKKINSEIEYDCNDDIEIYREQENIDILILNNTLHKNQKKYLILIENKINSNQHDNQLERYKKYAETNLNEYTCYFVYLKPENNEKIDDSKYKYITYEVIRDIIGTVNFCNIKQETALILQNYRQILDERYKKIRNISLMDICLRLLKKENKNEFEKLSQDKKELVWKFAEQRRYDIMQIIADILNNKMNDVKQSIYKVQFKKNNKVYAFDNTGTKDNSEIFLISYNQNDFNKLFLNEEEYNKIFYCTNEEMRTQLENKIESIIEKL